MKHLHNQKMVTHMIRLDKRGKGGLGSRLGTCTKIYRESALDLVRMLP
jgi:hypothetical protein